MGKNGRVPGPSYAISMRFYMGCLYVHGYSMAVGYTDPAQREVYVYDLDGQMWKVMNTTGEIPPVLLSASAQIVGEKFYLINGFQPVGYIQNYNIYILDLLSYNWSIADNSDTSNTFRTLYYAVLNEGSTFIVAGRDQFETYNSIIQVNFTEVPIVPRYLSNNWIFPSARKNHGLYLINKNLVLFGGIGQNG